MEKLRKSTARNEFLPLGVILSEKKKGSHGEVQASHKALATTNHQEVDWLVEQMVGR